MWVFHFQYYVVTSVAKKAFGIFKVVSYLGSFLALAGGISVFSFARLLLNLLHSMIPSKKNVNEIGEIPTLETRNVFHELADRLYHLKMDVTDFITMSSIHCIRNLTGSFKAKIFWLLTISVATTACVHFVSDSFKLFPQNRISYELDDKEWNVNEVFLIFIL